MVGWGVPSRLKFLPGVGLGGGVKLLIYLLEGGGGFRATWIPLWLHPWLPAYIVDKCLSDKGHFEDKM